MKMELGERLSIWGTEKLSSSSSTTARTTIRWIFELCESCGSGLDEFRVSSGFDEYRRVSSFDEFRRIRGLRSEVWGLRSEV